MQLPDLYEVLGSERWSGLEYYTTQLPDSIEVSGVAFHPMYAIIVSRIELRKKEMIKQESLYDIGDSVWVAEYSCNAFVVQVELPRNKQMRQEPQYSLAQSREQRAHSKMGKCSWYEDSELSVSP
jgi:hypothetical protein